MRVLIACEFSGIVRDAFRERGHDAISVDLLPSERPGPHIIGDAIEIAYGEPFDLMVAHPPCTYLTNSGVRWLYVGGGGYSSPIDPERWALMEAGAAFFRKLYDAPIERVAVENPIMHGFARDAIGGVKQSQVIQPWQFGHGETKATALWLRGLPPLVPTEIVDGREPRVHHASPGADRWRERSRTLPGIAAAMAAQWGATPRNGADGT